MLSKEEIRKLPIVRTNYGYDYYGEERGNFGEVLVYNLVDCEPAGYLTSYQLQPDIIWELVHENAKVPTYNNEKDGSAAGMDLYSPISVTIPARGKINLKLGIKSEIPPGHYMKIEARSGTSWKFCIETGAGVIDWGYGDEWGGVLYNFSDEPYHIVAGDRVAQAILMEYKRARNIEGKVRSGRGGFGSSGR